MARFSSAFALTVLSVAALICMTEATDGPKVTDILVSKDFQAAVGKAWKESFLGNDLYQQQGGWVYADSNNPNKYLVVQPANSQRSAQATQSTEIPHMANSRKSGLNVPKAISAATAQNTEIQLDNPEKDGVPTEDGKNYKVVADFHTHPFSGQERPNSDDVSKAYKRGVPAIVVSCSGVFYYGPQSRDSMDGPVGYPQTSSQQYNGQKEVRFGDNTVDSEGHCKP